MFENEFIEAYEAGFTGKIKLKDESIYQGMMTYILRRMAADRMHEYHPQYNNMFFVIPGEGRLFYQNSEGKKFVLMFQELKMDFKQRIDP